MLLPSHSVDSTNTCASSSLQCSGTTPARIAMPPGHAPPNCFVPTAMDVENINLNAILDRTSIEADITEILQNFTSKSSDVQFKKGIYVYGAPGCGKTHFVMNLLKKLDYDIIRYDAGDVRNKAMVDTITSDNVSNCNVLKLMTGKVQKIAIVMDEIDGMNSGDKGGISSLIKLIRQKKTKKQRLENATMNPVICIGNYFVDKKIKELMKVCHTFELKMPTERQTELMVSLSMPTIRDPQLLKEIHRYIQSDIRKLKFLQTIYKKNAGLITTHMMQNIFHTKSYNDDSKQIIQQLFEKPMPINEHSTFMNETDRTTVALLWHENVVDRLAKIPREIAFPFYLKILNNICFADYIDRITFQNQIWIFNEMSSLIKTFHNNRLYHTHLESTSAKQKYMRDYTEPSAENIRFTKVLTKYSTEYNNLMFVFMLCQELNMDRNDMVAFFQELRVFYGKDIYVKNELLNDAEKIFVDKNITKLDIKRIYRYLDKNVKRETANNIDDANSDDEYYE
jgi:SpoVK/Ycf46/Vps4 family AAA+-type ATPase